MSVPAVRPLTFHPEGLSLTFSPCISTHAVWPQMFNSDVYMGLHAYFSIWACVSYGLVYTGLSVIRTGRYGCNHIRWKRNLSPFWLGIDHVIMHKLALSYLFSGHCRCLRPHFTSYCSKLWSNMGFPAHQSSTHQNQSSDRRLWFRTSTALFHTVKVDVGEHSWLLVPLYPG